MGFDVKCWNLANDFIDDTPSLRPKADELAQVIQDSIQDWLEDQEGLLKVEAKVKAIAEAAE